MDASKALTRSVRLPLFLRRHGAAHQPGVCGASPAVAQDVQAAADRLGELLRQLLEPMHALALATVPHAARNRPDVAGR